MSGSDNCMKEEKGGDRKEPLVLREVAGAGGGDPPGSAAAPLSSFLRRQPVKQVPWREQRAATVAAPPGVARHARPRAEDTKLRNTLKKKGV
ncbi:Hypothetical predicted protein [Marmota monax]|uniref:Uncharacterized protein n=1 Tax=Marmota monax TaxID=9995 RepID=A0A5E4C8Y6_MARMO|nr:Hypothetical predicted protein [Marmota monax]